jgi:hypothetical protein
MKKLLQFVALVLALFIPAQPLLSECAYTEQRACDSQRMMDCCPPADGAQMVASTLPMVQGEPGPMVVGPRLCNEGSCYAVSAEMAPAIPATNASGVVGDGASVVRATWLAPKIWATAKRLPGVRVSSPTARYILFRNFRI